MPRGPNLVPLAIGGEQREQLETWTGSSSMAQGLVLRARMVLACVAGLCRIRRSHKAPAYCVSRSGGGAAASSQAV